MNKQEKWVRWKPDASQLEGNYYIQYVEDGVNGFRVVLSQKGTDQVVDLFYAESVLDYRKGDQNFRAKLFGTLAQAYGEEFCSNWSFFLVEQSSYLNWLNEDSKHYVILGFDSVIDLVTDHEPEINFIQMEEVETPKIKILADGSVANVREFSKDGRAVLEIFKNYHSTKTIYGKTE